MGAKMSNVIDRTGAQIIQDDDPLTACDQGLGKVRSNESGASRNKSSHRLLQTSNLQKQAVAKSAPHAPHGILPSNLLALASTATRIGNGQLTYPVTCFG